MPANNTGSMLLRDGTQKALSRKEKTLCFQWPGVPCSTDNFLVLVDECHIPLAKKASGRKLDLRSRATRAFL